LSILRIKGDGQAEFKRHIEPRRARFVCVEFHPGKIVNGKRATADQFDNLLDPVPAAGNLDGGAWLESEMNQT
jgi:hypothetical protein